MASDLNTHCDSCKDFWLRPDAPAPLATSYERHGRLYHCQDCDSYWEELERYVAPISREDAEKFYPEAFSTAT